MPIVNNGVEAYQPDQLVVEQRDTGLVQEALRRLGIASTASDSSDRLSLALLDLPGVDSEAAVLRQDSALVEAAVRARQSSGQAADAVSDLDLVVFALRRSMREAYDGWCATVGKNRTLDGVLGLPYIKGGVGQPEPLGPLSFLSIPPVAPQPGARVAILDTKLYAHPGLAGRYLGEPVADFDPPVRVTQGHCTFIAGLIAQRAPAAGLIVGQVLDDNGRNSSSWDVAKKMVGVLDADVAVLNLSFGCATIDRVAPFCLSRAVERLTPTVVVVAAAGNNATPGAAAGSGLTIETPMYPAAIDGVVAVGAYDSGAGSHDPAAFSPAVPWVDLLAPGVRVQSTFLPGKVHMVGRDPAGQPKVEADTEDFGQPGYAIWDGTSFAAANVTGAIAALIVPGHVSAYEALDQLRNPVGPAGDIFPYRPIG